MKYRVKAKNVRDTTLTMQESKSDLITNLFLAKFKNLRVISLSNIQVIIVLIPILQYLIIESLVVVVFIIPKSLRKNIQNHIINHVDYTTIDMIILKYLFM